MLSLIGLLVTAPIFRTMAKQVTNRSLISDLLT
jgi:hypothetical protein